jgi:hypothetical protein
MEAAALIERSETAPATTTPPTPTSGSPTTSRVDATGVVRTLSVIGDNEVVAPVTTLTLAEYAADDTRTAADEDLDSSTFLPGAYAAQGARFHAGGQYENELTQQRSLAGEESEDYDIPLGGNGGTDCAEAMESGVVSASVVSGISTDVTASIVDDAEAIYEAKDVRQDHCLRNILMLIIGGTTCCVLIVTLSLVLSGKNEMADYTGDPLCQPPVEEQSVAVRCYCSNSTGGLLSSMPEDQQYAYMKQLMFLQRHGIVPEDIDFDEDGCDPLNQDLLITANMTSQMETTGELFNRGSDEFR